MSLVKVRCSTINRITDEICRLAPLLDRFQEAEVLIELTETLQLELSNSFFQNTCSCPRPIPRPTPVRRRRRRTRNTLGQIPSSLQVIQDGDGQSRSEYRIEIQGCQHARGNDLTLQTDQNNGRRCQVDTRGRLYTRGEYSFTDKHPNSPTVNLYNDHSTIPSSPPPPYEQTLAGINPGPLLATIGSNGNNRVRHLHGPNDLHVVPSSTGHRRQGQAGQEALGASGGPDPRTPNVTRAIENEQSHHHPEGQYPVHRPIAHRLGRRPNTQPSVRTDDDPRGADIGARTGARPRAPVVPKRGAPRTRGKKRGKGGNRQIRPPAAADQPSATDPGLQELDPDEILQELERYFSDDTGGVQTNDSSTPQSVSRDRSPARRDRSPPARREDGWR